MENGQDKACTRQAYPRWPQQKCPGFSIEAVTWRTERERNLLSVRPPDLPAYRRNLSCPGRMYSRVHPCIRWFRLVIPEAAVKREVEHCHLLIGFISVQ